MGPGLAASRRPGNGCERFPKALLSCYIPSMPNPATLTIALPHETARRLAVLAAEEGGSPEAMAAEAVADMVNLAFDDGPERLRLTEAELRASLEVQMREIDEGKAVLIPHEEVMAVMRAKIAKASARKP